MLKWAKVPNGEELVYTSQCPDGVAYRVLYDSAEYPLKAYAVFFVFPKELLDAPNPEGVPAFHNWEMTDKAPVPPEIPERAALMMETDGLIFEMDELPVSVH